MTSDIAHELKTPLTVIHSYAEGLKKHIAEDKRDKYIDVILSEAERTDGMVSEMLDLQAVEKSLWNKERTFLKLRTSPAASDIRASTLPVILWELSPWKNH